MISKYIHTPFLTMTLKTRKRRKYRFLISTYIISKIDVLNWMKNNCFFFIVVLSSFSCSLHFWVRGWNFRNFYEIWFWQLVLRLLLHLCKHICKLAPMQQKSFRGSREKVVSRSFFTWIYGTILTIIRQLKSTLSNDSFHVI